MPRCARPLRLRAEGRRPSAAQGLPLGRAAALRAPPPRDPTVGGKPGGTRARRRHRIRRPAPVRPRRQAPANQLASDRTLRRALGQRHAPGAEHRRRHLPRHLRRGAARGCRDAGPGGARGRDARRAVPGPPGPRRARGLRRDPELADAGDRDRPAVPHRRRAARRRDPAQLRLEGHRRRSAPDAPAAGARRGCVAAPRRAGTGRARRPPPARLRHRRDRGLTRALRAAHCGWVGSAGGTALAAAPCGEANGVPLARGAGRRVARGRGAPVRDRGGGLIQAGRASRTPLVTGLAAVAFAAAVGVAAVAAAGELRLLAAGLSASATAVLAAGLWRGRSIVLPWALLALGAAAAASFADGGDPARSPLFAAGLLAVGELSYWSLETRLSRPASGGVAARRAALLSGLDRDRRRSRLGGADRRRRWARPRGGGSSGGRGSRGGGARAQPPRCLSIAAVASAAQTAESSGVVRLISLGRCATSPR